MKLIYPSRRVWNAHFSYRVENGDKPAYLSTMLTCEAAGALPQFGDPGKNVDRIRQQELAEMQGIRRETLTKRMSRIASPDKNWTQEKRDKQSENMKAIAANHPHWAKGLGKHKHPRDHVAHVHRCILTRNPGFASPNTYALAMPDEARPGLKAETDPTQHAAILAAHFGSDVYDPTARVNGWRDAWGWNFVAELPDAPDCSCRKQRQFDFQNVCPKCEGRGFTVGGSMPDFGRVILHFLNTRGIDEEIRRCDGCKYSYSQKQAKNWPNCPRCQTAGRISSHRGILENWTQKKIAKALGLHVSTVRRYFRTFTRLGLVRTVPGKLWRKCCGKLYDDSQCPKCHNKAGAIDHRDPWKILWLPSRTFDRDLVKAETHRMQALVRLHRRWLEVRQQEALTAAVDLSVQVLGEWEGHEHQLMSFYHEMRRRLNTPEHSRFVNVLFPLNTS